MSQIYKIVCFAFLQQFQNLVGLFEVIAIHKKISVDMIIVMIICSPIYDLTNFISVFPTVKKGLEVLLGIYICNH